MAPAPIAGRLAASGVWTGQEFLVWGGTVAPGDADGAAYDPSADSWRTMAASPLESRVGVGDVACEVLGLRGGQQGEGDEE